MLFSGENSSQPIVFIKCEFRKSDKFKGLEGQGIRIIMRSILTLPIRMVDDSRTKDFGSEGPYLELVGLTGYQYPRVNYTPSLSGKRVIKLVA